LVKRYAHLSPSHLKAAVEGVAGFGKVSPVGLESIVSVKDSESVSRGTVIQIGTAGVISKRGAAEVIEKIGAPDTN
jgi:hypothetical protein